MCKDTHLGAQPPRHSVTWSCLSSSQHSRARLAALAALADRAGSGRELLGPGPLPSAPLVLLFSPSEGGQPRVGGPGCDPLCGLEAFVPGGGQV